MNEDRFQMRSVFLLVLLAALLLACEDKTESFSIEVLNSYTPVKNQGKSQTCWAYAMLAAIETEHIMRGDSVNLSVAYVEKMLEREKNAPKSRRGMGKTLINLIMRHGIVAYDAMPTIQTPPPTRVFMLGAEYTPVEFAHSVCAPDEYIALTSVSDKPYYRYTVLDVPDNWDHSSYYNIPIDTLISKMAHAVADGRGVCWESKAHAMAVVGLALDREQQPYFIMKNSWGNDAVYHGLRYMSYRDVRRQTLAVCMPRDAFLSSPVH